MMCHTIKVIITDRVQSALVGSAECNKREDTTPKTCKPTRWAPINYQYGFH